MCMLTEACVVKHERGMIDGKARYRSEGPIITWERLIPSGMQPLVRTK